MAVARPDAPRMNRPVQVFEQAPVAPLRPFIRGFRVVEFDAEHHDHHFPDIGAVAALSFRGHCRLDGQRAAPAVFTGVHEHLRVHAHGAGHAVLLALFTPAGARAFLRPSLEEFAGASTDLAGVLAPAARIGELVEQLALADDHGARVAQLEAFLLVRLRESAPDALVTAAVNWLHRHPGRIDALARHIGLSQSALERRFRRVVGVSPKKLASLLRLRRALQLHAAGADFTAVAVAAGYSDQSHFIHEFRRVTGQAPRAFFRAAPNCYKSDDRSGD